MTIKFKKRNLIGGVEITFEPGNATRYHLSVFHTSVGIIVTDLVQGKYTAIIPKDILEEHLIIDEISYHLMKAGWAGMDATYMAPYILKAVKDRHWETYSILDEDNEPIKTVTVFGPSRSDCLQQSDDHYVSLIEETDEKLDVQYEDHGMIKF